MGVGGANGANGPVSGVLSDIFILSRGEIEECLCIAAKIARSRAKTAVLSGDWSELSAALHGTQASSAAITSRAGIDRIVVSNTVSRVTTMARS